MAAGSLAGRGGVGARVVRWVLDMALLGRECDGTGGDSVCIILRIRASNYILHMLSHIVYPTQCETVCVSCARRSWVAMPPLRIRV